MTYLICKDKKKTKDKSRKAKVFFVKQQTLITFDFQKK